MGLSSIVETAGRGSFSSDSRKVQNRAAAKKWLVGPDYAEVQDALIFLIPKCKSI